MLNLYEYELPKLIKGMVKHRITASRNRCKFKNVITQMLHVQYNNREEQLTEVSEKSFWRKLCTRIYNVLVNITIYI